MEIVNIGLAAKISAARRPADQTAGSRKLKESGPQSAAECWDKLKP
jgi:hypothetical protein